MELLLPMAAKKLDLSFNIEPDVPPCELLIHWHHESFIYTSAGVYADYPRIRQGDYTTTRMCSILTLISLMKS